MVVFKRSDALGMCTCTVWGVPVVHGASHSVVDSVETYTRLRYVKQGPHCAQVSITARQRKGSLTGSSPLPGKLNTEEWEL